MTKAATNHKTALDKKLADLVKTQKDLDEANGTLTGIESAWQDISRGLAAISKVWGAFSHNLVQIQKSLEVTDQHFDLKLDQWQSVGDRCLYT